MVQNVWLGLMAAGVVGIQFTIIPRLRRELLKLGKQRQLASRELAGRIGEVVDGIEAVHVHNTDTWERAEIGHRLFELFDLRFHIYKRKFVVKFLNNLLAQLTPFLFYAVGGYLALRGTPRHRPARRRHRRLSGAAAAAEGADRLGPAAPRRAGQVRSGRPAFRRRSGCCRLPRRTIRQADDAPLAGPLVGEDLARAWTRMAARSSTASSFDLSAAGPGRHRRRRRSGRRQPSPASSARRSGDYGGEVRSASAISPTCPQRVAGRRIAYAGVEPILFPGSIRDNLVYGLPARPARRPPRRIRARRCAGSPRRSAPAIRSRAITAPWIDCALAGAADEDELDRILIDLLEEIGLEEDIYRFGLSGMVDPEQHPELAGRADRGATPPARAAFRPRAWPISSSRSMPRATTTRRRSPKTSCSASRPRGP